MVGRNGHAASGRFLPKNGGGPGNPRAAQVERLRKELYLAASPEVFRQIVERLVQIALRGEEGAAIRAAEILLDRCLGRPAQALEISGDDAGPMIPAAALVPILQGEVGQQLGRELLSFLRQHPEPGSSLPEENFR